MGTVRGYVVAAHAAPTIAVWTLMTVVAWRVGWQGLPLVLVSAAVLVGQLSVGWSNDAIDAPADLRAERRAKPTVAGAVTARALWVGAASALVVACALSWLAAGWVGGSFHVLALAMAWLYNLVMSRTAWSWLPYAVAFGVMPAFLYVGLDGSAPPAWSVVAFAVVATSAHLANAIPDIDSDRAAGLGGLAVRLGTRRATLLCWVLLAAGTLVLMSVTWSVRPVASVVLLVAFAAAVLWATVRPDRVFAVLLVVVGIDVIALVATPAW